MEETPEKSKTKKIKKNVYQKLFAFKANLKEGASGGEKKSQAELLEEQECLIYYEDDIVNTGSCDSVKSENGKEIRQTAPLNYFKTTIHFVDTETGDEIVASSLVRERRTGNPADDDFTRQARICAFKALLGSPNNGIQSSDKTSKDKPASASSNGNAVSPTPAQTPSEPSGGVPNGFKGFNK